MSRLKGFRFPRKIIAYAIWAYNRFGLSTADVEELLSERGAIVSRKAVRKRVNRSDRRFEHYSKRDRPAAADKLHLDKGVVPINRVKI